MEVAEVIRLTNWYKLHTRDVLTKYNALVSVLQNNAQQPSQQPVSDPLKELSRALRAMPTEELSSLQFRVLEVLEVAELLGKRGRQWLDRKIRSTTYDPATTYQTIQQASQKITDASTKLTEFSNAAKPLGFTAEIPVNSETPYSVHVIFKDGASISNVRDWKATAADWELIVSGIAGVVGEKSEDIKVLGASNGSIIFTLGATPLVTKMLAIISKHIASIANDYLDFQLKRQELERSRMMSKAIRDDLDRQEKERRTQGKAAIIEDVKAMAVDAPPDAIAKLEKAIDKQIAFSEKGGEIDFVTPAEEDAGAVDDEVAGTISEIRDLVQEYRGEIQQTKLLSKPHEDDDEFDEE